MKTIIKLLLLLLFCGDLYSGIEYKLDYSLGAFGGTPFWNRESFEDGNTIDPNQDFYRLNNKLKFNVKYSDFSVRLNMIRSDNFFFTDKFEFGTSPIYFKQDDHLSQTRLYQLFGQYKFSGGKVQAGRLLPFNRWFFGTVDGGYIDYDITDKLSFMAYGGQHNLDPLFDFGSDNGEDVDNNDAQTLAYGELFYRGKGYNSKVKVLYSDEATKAGLDLYTTWGKFRFSGNFGYDFTNERLFDGALGVYGYLSPDLNLSFNYTRFTPISWTYRFYSEYIDRAQAAIAYKLNEDIKVGFRQMVSASESNIYYLSYLYLTYKYLFGGINYLGSDRGNELLGSANNNKFGVSLGANYAVSEDFRIRAGIAAVDYLFADRFKDSENAYSSFLRLSYKALDDLYVNGYINYYHNNDALRKKLRGGIQLNYRLKGGSK